MNPNEQAQTATAPELTAYQQWAALPATDEQPSSETEIDTASETAPASEPDDKAAETTEEKKPSKGKGLQKRFQALTTEIRELKAQLAGKPAAADEKGVATPPKDEPKADQTGKPVAANFNTYEDYVEALTDWKLEKREALRRQEAEKETRTQTVKTQVEAARAKHADYDQVVTNDVTVSPAMAEMMVGSEHGAEIAYYLGKHRDEAAKIAKMSPAQAGAALARIEVKLNAETSAPAAQPKPAPTTKAPKPPKTVTGSGGAVDAEPDPSDFSKWSKWKDRQERRERGD